MTVKWINADRLADLLSAERSIGDRLRRIDNPANNEIIHHPVNNELINNPVNNKIIDNRSKSNDSSDRLAIFVLDLRHASEFENLHIDRSINVSLPPILYKRLIRGTLNVVSAIVSSTNEQRRIFASRYKLASIVLIDRNVESIDKCDRIDDGTNRSISDDSMMDDLSDVNGWKESERDEPVALSLFEKLRDDGCDVALLEGGIEPFYTRYPHLCHCNPTNQRTTSAADRRSTSPTNHISTRQTTLADRSAVCLANFKSSSLDYSNNYRRRPSGVVAPLLPPPPPSLFERRRHSDDQQRRPPPALRLPPPQSLDMSALRLTTAASAAAAAAPIRKSLSHRDDVIAGAARPPPTRRADSLTSSSSGFVDSMAAMTSSSSSVMTSFSSSLSSTDDAAADSVLLIDEQGECLPLENTASCRNKNESESDRSQERAFRSGRNDSSDQSSRSGRDRSCDRSFRSGRDFCQQQQQQHYPLPVDYRFPVEIIAGLFLGNSTNAADRDMLLKYNIKYILNVTPDLPNVFENDPDFHYLQLPILDHWSQDLMVHFPAAIEFIDSARRSQCGVLVHCLAGISRSVTVTVAYLMHTLCLTLEDAYDLVKDHKPNIAPNLNFMGQLLDFQRHLYGENLPAAAVVASQLRSAAADRSSSPTATTTSAATLTLDAPPPGRRRLNELCATRCY